MKYLDLTGLGEVWANIKSYISSKIPTKTSQLQNDSNYATTSQLPSKTSQLTNDSGFLTSTAISNKADKATTLSGYGITDAYTKSQVDKKVSDLVNSAPETLDTLNELASALGNDPNFATTVANQIGTKANNSDVVHKSGNETINGTKTFSEVRTKFYKALDLYHDKDYKLNTNPSVKTYQYVFFTGKSGWFSGFVENQVDTNGDSFINICARNTNESVTQVRLWCKNDNTKYFYPGTSNEISLGTPTFKWKDVYATTFHGNLVGNADTATKATNNASGNELSNDIIKGLSVNGKVITYTKLDGSTGTITTQDTNTWTAFKGATASANGTAGYVPAPTKGNQNKFFRADGTWATPTNTTYSFTNSAPTLAWRTTSTIGTVGGVDLTVTMPANPDTHWTTTLYAGAKDAKSNAVTTNGNAFIKLFDNSVIRSQLNIKGSGATTVTTDANGVITISSTDNNTTYSVATTSKNGLMSSADKTKLDGLSNYTLPTASSTLGGVKTTSTVTSTSGLTACPIISGVVYYKDSNTDTKVTNTLGNTTRAYITGTTSAKTNTGTQIFDSGVYLTTTAGQLHADIDFPITEAQVNEILGIA